MGPGCGMDCQLVLIRSIDNKENFKKKCKKIKKIVFKEMQNIENSEYTQ